MRYDSSLINSRPICQKSGYTYHVIVIGIVTDQLFRRHDNGPGHPESPQRLDAVERGILSFTNDHPFLEIQAKRASMSDIALIHDIEYIEMLEQTQGRERTTIDHDTRTNRDSFDTALFAAGSAIEASKTVIAGQCNSAFCAVRPPGHHAEANRGMGFCLFNNAAIAARWARSEGCNRVAILDWDVHHGNGTMHSFYDDPAILYLSVSPVSPLSRHGYRRRYWCGRRPRLYD